MPPPGVQVHPQVKEPDKVVINLFFRPVAWAYVATFFGTLFISGLVTFTSTPYTPETDKITLFYGMFNPCIWFDHYPAKVFATTGMGIFLLIGATYSAMVFIYVYTEQRLFKVMWSGSLLCFTVLIDLIFVNVFTTNLYPFEDPPVFSGVRRLHGVHFGANNTVSLLEETELSQADINIIKLHTAFYILWVFGQLVLSFHMFHLAWERKEEWTGPERAKVVGLYTFGWYGMFLHAAAMLIIIMHPEPKVQWYFKSDLASMLQHIIIWFDAKTFTSAWGWVPIMLFRLIMPSGRGISLTFRLEKTEGDQGYVMPETWMNRTMWAMALVLAWGGVFDTEWTADDHAIQKLMYALRLKPYAYFGGPAFLGCCILLFVGLALQVIQRRLIRGRVPWAFALHAATFFVLTFSVVLVLLEKFSFVYVLFTAAQVVFVAWVWHMNKEEIEQGTWSAPVIYTLTGVAILVFASFSARWWLFFVYLIWMSLYGYFVPDGPNVYIQACRIDEPCASYKAVPHNVPPNMVVP